jgi:hypothetical protein
MQIYKSFPILRFVLCVSLINATNKYQWERSLQEHIHLNIAELYIQKDRNNAQKESNWRKIPGNLGMDVIEGSKSA